MKSIIQFINEKLKINSQSNVSKNTEVLDDILKHFEFDDLYEIDKGRLQEEPYITKEEGEEIKKLLQEFLDENNVTDKKSLKYFILQGHKFKDKKIAKDFRKHNPTVSRLNSTLHFAKDNKRIYKKESLYFEVSSEVQLIGMYGPFGGSKLCYFGE